MAIKISATVRNYCIAFIVGLLLGTGIYALVVGRDNNHQQERFNQSITELLRNNTESVTELRSVRGQLSELDVHVNNVQDKLDTGIGYAQQAIEQHQQYAKLIDDYNSLVASIDSRFSGIDDILERYEGSITKVTGLIDTIQPKLDEFEGTSDQLKQLIATSLSGYQAGLDLLATNQQLDSKRREDVQRLQEIITGFADKYGITITK